MKILGIITEYNPYHLGHRLHLQEAKKLILPDLTICVMSSSFVQRGEPAMISYREFDSCLQFFTNQIAQNVDYINAFEFFYCQICENKCTNMG